MSKGYMEMYHGKHSIFRNHRVGTYGDSWGYLMWSKIMYILQSDNCLYLLTSTLIMLVDLLMNSLYSHHPSQLCRMEVIPPSMGHIQLYETRLTIVSSGCTALPTTWGLGYRGFQTLASACVLPQPTNEVQVFHAGPRVKVQGLLIFMVCQSLVFRVEDKSDTGKRG